MFGQGSYLAYILIFAGSALLVEWFFQKRLLLKHKKVLSIAFLTSCTYTFFGENTAFFLQTWIFNPEKILGIFILRVPLESFIFGAMVGLAVVGGALFFSEAEEKHLSFSQTIKFFFFKRGSPS